MRSQKGKTTIASRTNITNINCLTETVHSHESSTENVIHSVEVPLKVIKFGTFTMNQHTNLKLFFRGIIDIFKKGNLHSGSLTKYFETMS